MLYDLGNEKTMKDIQEWKRIKEEAENNISALNVKVIEFLNKTEECETVDKKGNPILKFIGTLFKVKLSRGERESVDKAEVKKLLSDEDYQKVSKVSVYPVSRDRHGHYKKDFKL